MEEAANQLERDYVHSVYEKIAAYFNDSRYKAWPKVRQFLLDQEPGSIIADVGMSVRNGLQFVAILFMNYDYLKTLGNETNNTVIF